VGTKSNEASTTILMIDNRSGEQVQSSEGSAKNYDFSFACFSYGGGAFGSISGFTDKAQGKVNIAAFADAYNQMVKTLRNYKPQTVKSGLGTGGALKVDGAVDAVPEAKKKTKTQSTPTSEAIKSTSAVTSVNNSHDVKLRKTRSSISLDEIDERAMNDYYNALKGSVENLGNFSSMMK
jgi:hypothetical protein